MVVILCGGRKYADYPKVKMVLDRLDSEGMTVLVSGGCTGADRLARRWAEEQGYIKGPPSRPRVWERLPSVTYPDTGEFCQHKVYMEFPALWGSYGRAAGPMRNKEMLEETNPDLVVFFPGGTGTAGMKKLAEEAGVKVVGYG